MCKQDLSGLGALHNSLGSVFHFSERDLQLEYDLFNAEEVETESHSRANGGDGGGGRGEDEKEKPAAAAAAAASSQREQGQKYDNQ